MKRWIKRTALGLGCLLTVLVIAGAIFEAIARQQAAEKYPAPGKLVDIGNRKIQLDCRGSGSPTVVLESGLGNSGSLSWAKVHDSLAQTTRVCAYSRAGIMWSDPAPSDFDSKQAAKDLHAALNKANEKAPWVMVGHSLGGPHIMTFTSLYDKEVAGLVFVDASHPDQVERFRKVIGNSIDAEPPILKTPPILAEIGARIGIVRLMNLCSPLPNAPKVAEQAGCAYIPQTASANLQASQSIKTTLSNASQFRQLGERPLVVLTAMQKLDPEVLKNMNMSEEQGKKLQATWKELHNEQASWSSHSRHEIVTDSSHHIQFDRPDVVVKAVREVVTEVRKTSN